jgi:hypothetical protein
MICRLQNQVGIAVLEMAVASLMLLSLFLGGLGIVDYLNLVRAANASLEKSLNDSNFRAFTRVGPGQPLQFDRNATQQHLDAVLADTAAELLPQLPPGLQYFIEGRACPVQIDPVSGASLGVQFASCVQTSLGTLMVPPNVSAQADLQAEFSRQSAQVVHAGSVVSILAVPQGAFGWGDNSTEQYLEAALLVGQRVFISLDGTLSGFAFKQTGADPYVTHKRVIHLRGVIK